MVAAWLGAAGQIAYMKCSRLQNETEADILHILCSVHACGVAHGSISMVNVSMGVV